MSRPTLTFDPVSSSNEDWDKVIDTNFGRIKAIIAGQSGSGPVPLPIYSTTGSLPPAAEYNGCIVIVNVTGTATVQRIFLSDGVAWRRVPVRTTSVSTALNDLTGGNAGANIPAIPALTATASVTALRDDFNNNVLPKIRDALASLTAKLNEYRSKLIAADVTT